MYFYKSHVIHSQCIQNTQCNQRLSMQLCPQCVIFHQVGDFAHNGGLHTVFDFTQCTVRDAMKITENKSFKSKDLLHVHFLGAVHK